MFLNAAFHLLIFKIRVFWGKSVSLVSGQIFIRLSFVPKAEPVLQKLVIIRTFSVLVLQTKSMVIRSLSLSLLILLRQALLSRRALTAAVTASGVLAREKEKSGTF